MKRIFISFLAVAAVFHSGTSAVAQDKPAMKQLEASGASQGLVLNGTPAVLAEWPATFIFRTNDGGCTSTAIGRKVVLTAAHCVKDKGEAIITVKGKQIALTCYHHPDYLDLYASDFALCLLDDTLPDIDRGFERIAATSAPGAESEILLLGYGCTTNTGQRDFGNLFFGYAAVKQPSAVGGRYIRTAGGAAVCYGDSGGGAYLISDKSAVTKKRGLIGVNSRGDISTNSWLSSVAHDSFVNWAKKWATDRSVAICGLVGAEDNCGS